MTARDVARTDVVAEVLHREGCRPPCATGPDAHFLLALEIVAALEQHDAAFVDEEADRG